VGALRLCAVRGCVDHSFLELVGSFMSGRTPHACMHACAHMHHQQLGMLHAVMLEDTS
jgi:hypothetical protein